MSDPGWKCTACGHVHRRNLANICIGCPCPETKPQTCVAIVAPLKERRMRPCGANASERIDGRDLCPVHARKRKTNRARGAA